MSGCCPEVEGEGSQLEGCRVVSWALCLWVFWWSAQWKLLPEAGWALLQGHWGSLMWWEVSEGGQQGQSCWLTHSTSTGSVLLTPESCSAVFPSFVHFMCSQNTSPSGLQMLLSCSKACIQWMFAYPSHLEGLNVLQGTWALTCLLQGILRVAFGANLTQLPHHRLPPTSRWNSRSTWAGSGSWDGPSEQRGLGFLPGGGAVPAPKSRNHSQVMSVLQPEGKRESCCFPGSQISLAVTGGEGLRPKDWTEWNWSPLLLYCESWLCIFGGKMPVFPLHCVLPRSFPGGNPCNHVSTCWDRKILY